MSSKTRQTSRTAATPSAPLTASAKLEADAVAQLAVCEAALEKNLKLIAAAQKTLQEITQLKSRGK